MKVARRRCACAVGRGSVTVINASPLRYRGVFAGDHAWLFVAATQLRRGDDVHFLSEEEHPSLLALVWRYGRPSCSLALALIVLALWRGGVRFGPLAAAPPSGAAVARRADSRHRSVRAATRRRRGAACRGRAGARRSGAAPRSRIRRACRPRRTCRSAGRSDRLRPRRAGSGYLSSRLRSRRNCATRSPCSKRAQDVQQPRFAR